jgi:menaquinone-specific isochorismate synthase
VARTERLDIDLDLVDVAGEHGALFERRSRGLAGLATMPTGPASAAALGPLTVTVPRSSPGAAAEAIHDLLAAFQVEDAVGLPGCGPVAMGALPFSPDEPGDLLIPAVTIGRADNGTRWITTIGPVDASAEDRQVTTAHIRDALIDRAEANRSSGVAMPASDFRVASTRDPLDWCAMVAAARDELRRGSVRKVVLAREVVVSSDRPLSRQAVLSRLRRAYPSCMLYAHGGFVGATPELLVSRVGDIVRSHPMAGTVARSADPTTDARLAAALLSSAKDREEHRITIDMVHDTLLPYCSYLDEEAEPSVVVMANVQHLATMVEGRLSAPAASVVELMTALHPTPAVCGSPRDDALEMISRLEGFDRSRYAGPVGWVDAAGNGEWAVGIRCAEIDADRARLFAGVGVVADSDPAAELAETQAKFQALLSAVVRP